jgi:hypothetical protein
MVGSTWEGWCPPWIEAKINGLLRKGRPPAKSRAAFLRRTSARHDSVRPQQLPEDTVPERYFTSAKIVGTQDIVHPDAAAALPLCGQFTYSVGPLNACVNFDTFPRTGAFCSRCPSPANITCPAVFSSEEIPGRVRRRLAESYLRTAGCATSIFKARGRKPAGVAVLACGDSAARLSSQVCAASKRVQPGNWAARLTSRHFA